MTDLTDYYGRLFPHYQLTEEERQQAQSLSSVTKDNACFRCLTPFAEETVLPNGAFYCRECIGMGRIRTDELLYYFPQQPFPPQQSLQWQGTLTSWQSEISEALRKNAQNKQASLVHAVTGAGKTEMIYQVVADMIDTGGAVCLASPRVDVCIELEKRIRQDFSCSICLLHAEAEPYVRSPLVIATTHQLLKFYRAFDLLLIDEVDAFPYVDNPILYRAVDNAVKEDGVTLFLTATSTEELEKKVRKGSLERLRLPRRFHGNPLVVPKKMWFSGFEKQLKQNKLPPAVHQKIKEQQASGYPLLVFLPSIHRGQTFAQLLSRYFPDSWIGFVSSQTENRLEIVEEFRSKKQGILVSTTILERGVTFPGVDVFVLEAHHRLYTSSSLVQISGRVGRSLSRPTGELLFFHEGVSQAMEQAIREIQEMNKEAGYDEVSAMPARG